MTRPAPVTPRARAIRPAPATRPGPARRRAPGPGPPDQRFASCQEATAAGFGPYTKGTHEEYAWYADVDGNGVACNSGDLR
ncbi:excalibur calcium-binding domain-containing protein [Nonomuraea ferruginea]